MVGHTNRTHIMMPHVAILLVNKKEVRQFVRQSAEFGAPGKIRSPNLLIRSQTLYPVELRAQPGPARSGSATSAIAPSGGGCLAKGRGTCKRSGRGCCQAASSGPLFRSEEHTSELQSRENI